MAKKEMDKTEDLGGLLKDYKNNYKYVSRPYHKETPNFGHLLWINKRLEERLDKIEQIVFRVPGDRDELEQGEQSGEIGGR